MWRAVCYLAAVTEHHQGLLPAFGHGQKENLHSLWRRWLSDALLLFTTPPLGAGRRESVRIGQLVQLKIAEHHLVHSKSRGGGGRARPSSMGLPMETERPTRRHLRLKYSLRDWGHKRYTVLLSAALLLPHRERIWNHRCCA